MTEFKTIKKNEDNKTEKSTKKVDFNSAGRFMQKGQKGRSEIAFANAIEIVGDINKKARLSL